MEEMTKNIFHTISQPIWKINHQIDIRYIDRLQNQFKIDRREMIYVIRGNEEKWGEEG